jgi:hypothetical protein
MKKRKSIAVLILAGSLALGPAGLAAAQQGNPPYGGRAAQGETRPAAGQVEGVVTKVDVKARTIIIDGQAFEVGRGVDLSRMKPGERVRAELKLSKRGTRRVHRLEALPAAK